jgi:6,7-dimethyl-8-ribityllumazine synthase
MAQISYSIGDLPQTPNAKIAIIMSKWYRELSESMVRRCTPILEQAGCAPVDVHVVPGCLEIPLAARRLHQSKPDIEALIVFGIIVKGDTYHFDMVKNLTMSGIERVLFERDVPIINEILPVDKLEHAQARCADDDRNKGIEAALAAIEIIDWRRRNPV